MMSNVLNTDLSGKVAVVTGAGGVLCSAFAKVLARAGAKVALLDLNYDAADKFAQEIVEEGGVAEQDGLTADGKWVFLVRLRRGKLDKLLVHQIVKGNLPFPVPFKLQNLVQGGTADNSLAKGVVPALDIFLIGYLVGHGNSPF